MTEGLAAKFTLADVRAARQSARKLAMLTCYDFTTARLMQQAGVPMLLVGDSAAVVMLGHANTLPVSLSFMIEITAAVRRGAPLCFVVADMPFGSYQASLAQGVKNVMKMVKRSGCDCVKMELARCHLPLLQALADAGVAVMAHVGLRPQRVCVLGGYRVQGKTAEEAMEIVNLACEAERHGAVSILLEAVPPEVAKAVVDRTSVPVIGCGAGPWCHGSVVVTHDALGLSGVRPKFVPVLGDLATPTVGALREYARAVADGSYPGPQHCYSMPQEELERFRQRLERQGTA